MPIQPSATYTVTKQEFLNSVVSKIGKQEFSNKVYNNPLSRIRGEMITGPTDIEEIYVDRATDNGYDPSGTGVMDRVKPSVSVQYHTNTVEHAYKTTVQNKQMRKGFSAKGGLETMATTIVNSLHSGQQIDDYTDCINTLVALASAPLGTKTNVITVPVVSDLATSKQFTKAIKKTINNMVEWTSVYSDKPNFADAEDLILYIDSDTDVEVEVEHLAQAFNLSIAQLNETTKIKVPKLSTKLAKCTAILAHRKCLKINPCYYDMDSIKNTKGKFVNYDLATETLCSYTTWYPYAVFKTA